ncbi:hypothetical protein LI177_05795 [bacterium 210820-DFI.6.37]|nr:hypothetical protein [bacterium 210820-DFI.6.37]
MTTIALPILVMLAVILLLIIINMILWQKQASIQLSRTREVQERLEGLGQALQELNIQNERLRQELEEDRRTETPRRENIQEQPLRSVLMESGEAAERNDDLILDLGTAGPEDVYEAVEITENSSPSETGPEEKDDLNMGGETPEATIYNIGKSGKVYTEEELELLIKE